MCQNVTTEFTGYFLRIRYNDSAYRWTLSRWNGGAETVLIAETAFGSANPGDKYGIEVVDNVIQCYRYEEESWETLGSSYDDSGSGSKITTAGYLGFDTDSDAVRIDDVGGGPTLSITQEGYRWRLDDGNQANATWAASQDTGITAPANTTRRLRVLLDTSGDANATTYQLEYKEANDANWTKVS
jgi:hypothetical protein